MDGMTVPWSVAVWHFDTPRYLVLGGAMPIGHEYGFSLGVMVAAEWIYVVPPLLCSGAARVVGWSAVATGEHVSSRSFRVLWWLTQVQRIFKRIGSVEDVLRMIPGAYSVWLNGWGAMVSLQAFGSPGVPVLARFLLHVGEGVVRGIRSVIAVYGVSRLTIAPMTIGDRAPIVPVAESGSGCRVHAEKSIPLRRILPVYGVEMWNSGTRKPLLAKSVAIERSTDNPQARAMPPTPSQIARLKAKNTIGGLYVVCCTLLTAVALGMSYFGGPLFWIVGQILLSVAFLQWFVLLHEAGHYTLFRSRSLNTLCGHVASFFAIIPFHCWKLIHDRHHVWTGWQDLDATTESLVPRTLRRHERVLVNVCWKTWLPLFSIIYRLNNFWNLPRLRRFVSNVHHPRILKNIALLLVSYVTVVYWIGFLQLVSLAGLAVFLTLVYQDPLLLSQHTHIPQNLSRGQKVNPFSPLEQEQFTRSLTFPAWVSKGLLLNFGTHELHHMYVHVPGYCLDQITYLPRHVMPWWRWLLRAKRISGETFLFQNQTQSGLDI